MKVHNYGEEERSQVREGSSGATENVGWQRCLTSSSPPLKGVFAMKFMQRQPAAEESEEEEVCPSFIGGVIVGDSGGERW